MSDDLKEMIRLPVLSVPDVLDAVRNELQATNGKTPNGAAAVESIEVELNCVIRREPSGAISIRVAERSNDTPVHGTPVHVVRLRLKPDKWG